MNLKRKRSQRKALSDVISCSTENDIMTEERADTLIRSSVVMSDSFSNWSNIVVRGLSNADGLPVFVDYEVDSYQII